MAGEMKQYQVDFVSANGVFYGSLILVASSENEAEKLALNALDEVEIYVDYPNEDQQVIFETIDIDYSCLEWEIEQIELVRND